LRGIEDQRQSVGSGVHEGCVGGVIPGEQSLLSEPEAVVTAEEDSFWRPLTVMLAFEELNSGNGCDENRSRVLWAGRESARRDARKRSLLEDRIVDATCRTAQRLRLAAQSGASGAAVWARPERSCAWASEPERARGKSQGRRG